MAQPGTLQFLLDAAKPKKAPVGPVVPKPLQIKPQSPTVQGMVGSFNKANKTVKTNNQTQAKMLLGGMTDTVQQGFDDSKNNARKKMADSVLNKTAIDANTLKFAVEGLPEENKRQIADMVISSGIEIIGINEAAPSTQSKTKGPNKILSTLKKGAELISPTFNAIDSIGVENIGKAGLGALSGVAKAGSGIAKSLSRLDPTLSKQEREKLFSDQNRQSMSTELARTVVPGIEKSGVFQGGQLAGELGSTVALTYPIGGGVKGLGLLGKTLLGAGAGATQTQIANIANEGELATVGETALGAGIGGLLGGGSQLLKSAKKGLFGSAFSQTSHSTKKDLAKYGQTAGEAVLEQKLPPSIKKGIVAIKDKLDDTWKAIEQTADSAGNIKGSTVKAGLKNDLIKKLGYDKLNQSAQTTKDLINKVGSVVDDMIPDGLITPKEIVQQIKQINSTLPNTLLSKGFQDLKGNSKIQKVITTGLKDILDKAVENGGGSSGMIKQLYAQYGKQKTVQKILEDESIRKILGRQLAGGVGGAGVGAIAGMEDFKQGDIFSGLGKVLAFSLVGTQAAKLAKDPDFLMKLGNAVEKISKGEQATRAGASFLSSKLK